MFKSPLRYPGGKSKAIPQIMPLVPYFEEFREPFVGGGSVFIQLSQVHHSKLFWINDLYEPLYLFWSFCQTNTQQLISQILEWKQEFAEGKELYTFLLENRNEFDALKKAAAFFVFNRITFSGTTESGGYSEAAFKGRFTDSSIERVKSLSVLLNCVKITNLDYEYVVKSPGENVFIFLDPPYFSATKSALYGKNGQLHKTFDHQRFANVMKDVKHKWLITYDDSDYIRDLFSFANIQPWDITYGMRNVSKNSNQKGKELFISNFEMINNFADESSLFNVPYVSPQFSSLKLR
ncbi:MAG: DNA adenine methylase [Ignavibacteriaceae bacterium]|nr:DNA adenine methylase [Ignavibacteriaceae bacterium]